MTDRKDWETKGSKDPLKITDDILVLVQEIAPGFTLKYNKHDIGLNKQSISKNFIGVIPRRKVNVLHVKLRQTDETQEHLDRTDMDVMPYEKQWNRYRLRLTEDDVQQNKETLMQLIKKAYDNYES